MRRMKIEKGNYGLALAQAHAFYLNADIYLSKMSDGYDQAGKYAIKNQRELFVAATNLALSIELSFKGILLYNGKKIPTTHKIDTLFKELNKDIRDAIEKIYEEKKDATPPEKIIKIYLLHRDTYDIETDDKDIDINSVLRRNSDNFIAFRYIYEKIEDEKLVKILEFTQLKMIVLSSFQYCKNNKIFFTG